MMVTELGAGAGIILTASHNPKQWNALKLLNDKGEFISAKDGEEVLANIDSPHIIYSDVDKLGTYAQHTGAIALHIEKILALPLVNIAAVQARKFRVVLDSVNSTGSISMVPLLQALGCEVFQINGEPTGRFAHNPEPLPEHLNDLAVAVEFHQATRHCRRPRCR